MTKVLVISDPHLRPRVRIGGVTLEGDCIHSIRILERYVEKIKPDYCIIAGDIFHQTKVSDEELKLFENLLRSLHIPSKNVLTIQGNHDRGFNSISSMFGCTDLNTDTVKIEDITVRGIKFTNTGKHREFLKEVTQGTTINVVHDSCKPFSNFGLDVLDVEDFPIGFSIVGHTHISKLYSGKERDILSPGCLFPGNKDEISRTNSTGAWVLYIEGNEINNVVQLDMKSRKCFDLTYMTNEVELEKELLKIGSETQEEILAPVVIIDSRLSSVNVDPRCIIIPVVTSEEAEEAVEAVNTQIPIFERMKLIVENELKDDPQATYVSTLLNDLVVTDNYESVINDKVKEVMEDASIC